MVEAIIIDAQILKPTTRPRIGDTSKNRKIAKIPKRIPYKIPRISPTRISFNKIFTEFSSPTRPVANPRTIMVEDCVPILPPIPIITGMNAASTIVFCSISSKTPIINAARIPPTQLANSHGRRMRALSQEDFKRISRSLPAPTICKKSSVASSRIMSTTSSTITIPNSWSSESTTGTARKLY